MAYNVELSESAERELGKLDASQAKRILKFLHQRVAKLAECRGWHLTKQVEEEDGRYFLSSGKHTNS